MTPEQKEFAIAAVEIILKHGAPAFIAAVKALKTDNPSLDEIRALRVAKPETYFGKKENAG